MLAFIDLYVDELFWRHIFSLFVGEIHTTTRRLDREKQAEHVLEVTIIDGYDPSATLSSTTYITVNVLDENDHAPVFLERLYKFFVPVIAHQKPQMDGTTVDKDYIEDMPIGQVCNTVWFCFYKLFSKLKLMSWGIIMFL